MKTHYLDSRLVFSPQLARTVRAELSSVLPHLNFDKAMMERVQLVVSEWLENLRVHAQLTPSWVHLELIAEHGEFLLLVQDNGSRFAAFDEALSVAENKIENESGRGLYLLRELFPHHHYRITEAGHNLLEIGLGNEKPKRLQILLIDDDPVISRLISCYLQETYRVDNCADAHAALSFLDRHQVDLILCDINMPGESGISLRKQLLTDGRWQDTPFVFISGEESSEIIAAAERLAVDDYLVKPVTKDALLRVVNRVINRSAQLRQSLGAKVDEQLTRPLTPTLPPAVGVVSCHLRSTTASPGGGDVVLWHEMPDRTQVVFADLMGHGAKAKYYAHALAGYLRGILSGTSTVLAPGQILTLISDALYDDQLLNSTIATCMVMSIQPDGRIEMASGGHPPGLLWRDQQWSPLALSGGLPGLLAGQSYETSVLKMEEGERLLIASDGLWEQGDSRQERHANETTMLETIDRESGKQPEIFIEDVWRAFMKLADHKPSDDVTLALFDRRNNAA